MKDITPGQENKYSISELAKLTIEAETRKFPDEETGGILAGLTLEGQTHITHATGPGPNATHDSLFFVKDTPFLQEQLNYMFDYYGTNYLGVWHKHPPSMEHPSSGDVVSATEEIESDNNDLTELLIPICTVIDDRVRIHPFVARDGKYLPVSWQVTESLPERALRQQTVQWHTTRSGSSRLAKERSELESQSVAFELRESADKDYRFHLDFEDYKLILLCPADFPLSAPTAVIHNVETGTNTEYESELLTEWDFRTSAADIFADYRTKLIIGKEKGESASETEADVEDTASDPTYETERSDSTTQPSYGEIKASLAILGLSIIQVASLLISPDSLLGLMAILTPVALAKYVILLYYRSEVRALMYSTAMLLIFDCLIFIMGNAYRIGLARPINEIF